MDSQYIGAKFYSKSDLSIGWNLEKAEKIINVFDETNTGYTTNNILEMYNICLLFDSKVMLQSWSEEYYRKLTSVANSFRPIIGRFFSDIDYLCIKTFYPEISIHYRDSFWDVFETYKIYKNISPEEFISLLEIFNVPLYIILEHKDIVQYYNNEISDYMKQSKSSADILISHHLASKERNHKIYYIPSALQTNRRIEII
ncbi:hypothetical protein ACFOW0_00435 [Citroniella saccharovorans]